MKMPSLLDMFNTKWYDRDNIYYTFLPFATLGIFYVCVACLIFVVLALGWCAIEGGVDPIINLTKDTFLITAGFGILVIVEHVLIYIGYLFFRSLWLIINSIYRFFKDRLMGRQKRIDGKEDKKEDDRPVFTLNEYYRRKEEEEKKRENVNV